MVTTDPATETISQILGRTVYRDAFNHCDRYQRIELRKEYRWLRQMDMTRHAAKGLVLRIVTLMQGWD